MNAQPPLSLFTILRFTCVTITLIVVVRLVIYLLKRMWRKQKYIASKKLRTLVNQWALEPYQKLETISNLDTIQLSDQQEQIIYSGSSNE